tara:strand:- start:1884 stop:2846 length:963 start_codon:yes stop_codon:yes gene_type:complete
LNVKLGNYKLDCNFDPKIQDNSSGEKILINDIGFIYNCVYKQKDALIHSVDAIQQNYKDSKIYIVSDGGLDYSFLNNQDIKSVMRNDTVSPLKKINSSNFLEKNHQDNLKIGMKATIDRLIEGIKYCEYPKWFCMTEPDVLIRGKITHPENAKLLGSRVNYAWYKKEWIKSFIEINKVLQKIEGSIPLMRWGSVPVIGHTNTLIKAIEKYHENFEILDSLTEKFHAVCGFDLFLPLLFSLVGEEEVFSSEYTECIRNPNWESSSATVVHQYRKYYENNDYYVWDSKPKKIKILFKWLSNILTKFNQKNNRHDLDYLSKDK